MADAPAPDLTDLPDNWLEALLAGGAPAETAAEAYERLRAAGGTAVLDGATLEVFCGCDAVLVRHLPGAARGCDTFNVVQCSCTGEGEHEFRGKECQYAGKPRPQLTPFSRTSLPAASMTATGTCPDCARPGVVIATRTAWGTSPDHRAEGHPLGVMLELVEHKTPGRATKGGGQVCSGAGKLPRGFRFTPSAEVVGWLRSYGPDSVTVR